jgi:hypothetical protein
VKDIYYYNESLCSIAQIENSFSGKYILRDILNRILRNTFHIIATIERPFYTVQSSIAAISNTSSELENLNIDEKLFSISFKYYTKENNDDFINLFLEVWFEYEQPTFSFFTTGQNTETYKNLEVHRRMNVEQITALSPCYVLFRGIEEDVLWVGLKNARLWDNLKLFQKGPFLRRFLKV